MIPPAIIHVEVPIQLTRENNYWIAEIMVEDFWHTGFGDTQEEAIQDVGLFYRSAVEGMN